MLPISYFTLTSCTHKVFTNYLKIYKAGMLGCFCIQCLKNAVSVDPKTLDKTKAIHGSINL